MAAITGKMSLSTAIVIPCWKGKGKGKGSDVATASKPRNRRVKSRLQGDMPAAIVIPVWKGKGKGKGKGLVKGKGKGSSSEVNNSGAQPASKSRGKGGKSCLRGENRTLKANLQEIEMVLRRLQEAHEDKCFENLELRRQLEGASETTSQISSEASFTNTVMSSDLDCSYGRLQEQLGSLQSENENLKSMFQESESALQKLTEERDGYFRETVALREKLEAASLALAATEKSHSEELQEMQTKLDVLEVTNTDLAQQLQELTQASEAAKQTNESGDKTDSLKEELTGSGESSGQGPSGSCSSLSEVSSSPDKLALEELKAGGQRIGEGTYGEVYLLASGGVLKCPKKNNEEELRREGKLLETLLHPNVLKVLDWQFGLPIFEYCEGQDLYEAVMEDSTKEELASYLYDVASGVAYLHQQVILHRDLKPENFFLKQGVVVVGDFGCAKRASTSFTKVGTEAFWSPEVRARRGYSPGSDVWAIGKSFRELSEGLEDPMLPAFKEALTFSTAKVRFRWTAQEIASHLQGLKDDLPPPPPDFPPPPPPLAPPPPPAVPPPSPPPGQGL